MSKINQIPSIGTLVAKKIFILSVSSILTLPLMVSSLMADYNDAGTDYSNASNQSWFEDASKQALNLANAFVCIIKNSNADTRPNGTWRYLIDETDCFDGGGNPQWADVINVSTRASNTSDQEVVAYFTTSLGDNYVVNASFNNDEDSAMGNLTMLFRFYQAYGENMRGGSGPDLRESGYVEGQGPDIGYVEVVVEDYNNDGVLDTVIRSAETFTDSVDLASLVVKYGGAAGSSSTSSFLVTTPDYTNGLGATKTYAGATSGSDYRRETLNDEGQTIATACFTTENPFQSTYRYGVYDFETGEELAIQGSFDFFYEQGASGDSGKGFMGHWGVWFENNEDSLSHDNSSLNVTRRNSEDDSIITLNWSPGKLWQRDSSRVDLMNGEKFEVNDSSGRYNIEWQTDKFVFSQDIDLNDNGNIELGEGDVIGGVTEFVFNIATGGVGTIGPGNWLWSKRFNSWVAFVESEVIEGAYELHIQEDKVVKADWTGASGQGIDSSTETTLICARNCPDSDLSYSEYNTFFRTSSNNNVGDEYILTPYNESREGIYPLSLYKGTVSTENLISLNPDDSDFASNDEEYANIWAGDFILDNDPADNCGISTDPDANDNVYNCSNLYQWLTGLGANSWSQYVFPTTQSGDPITIQDPINFQYTHLAANDKNRVNYPDENNPFYYNLIETDWSTNEETISLGETYYASSIPSGSVFNLQYEGAGQLYGLESRKTDNGWLVLLNLEDGSEIIRTSDDKKFVVKALETGLLANQTVDNDGNNDCSAAPEIDDGDDGFKSVNILPSPNGKTPPTQAFNNAPEVDEIHVKHGEDIKEPSEVQ